MISGKKKNEYDVNGMRDIIEELVPQGIAFAVIERIHVMPKMGKSAAMTFGLGWGLWRMALAFAKIPCQVVSASSWRKEILRGMPGDDPHQKAILAAENLFPNVKLTATDRARKPNSGACDALCLCEYARVVRTFMEDEK